MTLSEDLLSAAQAHHRAGRLSEAETLYRDFLTREPDHVQALHLLGVAVAAQGRCHESIELLRRAVALRPDYAEAVYNLARALHDDSQLEAAAATYQRAIDLRPSFAPAHNNLGIVFQAIHDFEGAEAAYRAAIGTKPDYPKAHYNLGNVLKELNRVTESIESYQRALALKPDYPQALINLGNVLQRTGDLDGAIAAFSRALSLQPDLSLAHNSLGNALKDSGRLDEAIESYRRSISTGGKSWAWDNLLYTLHFHPGYDARRIAQEHARWNATIPKSPGALHFPNDRSPDRPLKVAYVSPDFREHPVGRFMLPLLSNHDHNRHRIVCYSDVRYPDAMTEALRSHANLWRDTERLSDDQLAAQIRADAIDILVDLTMHMDGNRLQAFAQSAAPVQVTYLAYCSTTGLSAMNYRLTDSFLDPPDSDLSVYSEQTERLRSYWCYQPPKESPDVAAAPAASAGHVTFGSLNNYSKVTAPTWETWCRILHDVPNSRLIVQSPSGAHRDDPRRLVLRGGIDPDRLTFVARVPLNEYLTLYNKIDIALDPFPYGGGTTTCDALWMGVPVVTLAGSTAVSRGGSSILNHLGFPQWIASDPSHYVNITRKLASGIPALSLLRSAMRSRMLSSLLMDGPAFARDFESALRRIWINWSGK